MILPSQLARLKSGTTTLTAEDYTLTGSSATISAGDLEQTNLAILPDNYFEADESFTITLDGANITDERALPGSRLTHDYQITNDDSKPEVRFTASNASGSSSTASTVSEADGSIRLTVDYVTNWNGY